jgi:hypothetical protein
MTSPRRRLLMMLLAALLLAVAATVAAFLKGPDIQPSTAALADPELRAAAQRLEAALGGIEGGLRESAAPPARPGADTVLEWQDGLAELSSSDGRVLLVTQTRQTVDPDAVLMSAAELDQKADDIVASLGWSQGDLEELRFRAEPGGVQLAGTAEYRKTWRSYTPEGIADTGLIDVRLDARNGALVFYAFVPGVAAGSVDAKPAISEDQAIAVAEKTARDRIAAALGANDLAETVLEQKAAELRVTDARGVTGGAVKLVWRVEFEGLSPQGVVVGGTAFVDAMTCEVLEYLSY